MTTDPSETSHPSGWRLCLGFLLAPMASTFAVGAVIAASNGGVLGLSALFFAMLIGTPIALVWSAIVGLPTYSFLRNRARPTVPNVTLAGGGVTTAPWIAILVITGLTYLAGATLYPEKGGYEVDWGSIAEAMKATSSIYALGSLGGLVFWLAVYWRGPRLSRPTARHSHGARGSRASISS